MNPELFEPYDRLIEVKVLGKRVRVPDNNTILRCLQYLSLETVSYSDLCWNGECLNCKVWVKKGEGEKTLVGCTTKAEEGMQILRISKSIKVDL